MAEVLERPTPPARHDPVGATGGLWIGGALLALVALILLGMQLGYRDVDVWGGIVLPVLLFAVIAPVVAAVERRQPVPLVGLLVGGLAARLLGAWLRYLVSFHVYAPTDPLMYHHAGTKIAARYWAGDLSLAGLVPRGTSTQFIRELSGVVHTFDGASLVGSFMVFTVFSYLGGLLLVHAARTAVPDLLAPRYAALVLFLPSMLYWPSSLGKDGPMQLGIGLAAFGAARLFTGRPSGWVWAMAGTFLAGVIRPHVAVLLVAAAAVPVLFGSSGRASVFGPLGRVVGTVVIVVGLTAAIGAMSGQLDGFDYSDPFASTDAILTTTEGNTAIGGSAIETVRPNSPLEYPFAAFTVLFRPLLLEADSATTLASAVEGTVLLVLAWRWRANLRAGLARVRTNRYVGFVVAYSVGFMLAWSSINNLGIIARQRVMMLPLLAILACVPPPAVADRSPR